MTSIRAACDTTYKASKHSGTRSPNMVRWIVLHDTEGGSARSVARYFASPDAGGSTHLVIDDVSCYRTLHNLTIPQGAPGANIHGFHIEQCGWARWTPKVWRMHLPMLRRAAYKTALHCRVFGIPVRFVRAHELLASRRGITTHAECSRAFGGTHHDPGDGWPRALFMSLVRAYAAELAARERLSRLR